MTFSNFHQFGEQINRYFSSPQVVELSNQAKKIGDDVAKNLKTVTDQMLTQTKEIRQEISTVITKEANNFVEMCNGLNEELTKTCRYSTPTRQQNTRPVRVTSVPINKPVPVQVPAPAPATVQVPVPAPAPVPVVVPQVPVPVPVPVLDEYAWERTSLRQMGFSDDARINDLLKKYRGDLNECLNALCNL